MSRTGDVLLPPRWVRVSWALACLAGLLAVLAPGAASAPPAGSRVGVAAGWQELLSLVSVPASALPVGAVQIRLLSVRASDTGRGWQAAVTLSWVDRRGRRHAAELLAPAGTLVVLPAAVALAPRGGAGVWETLTRVLRGLPAPQAGQLAALAATPTGAVVCSGSLVRARCRRIPGGQLTAAVLRVTPAAGPFAVSLPSISPAGGAVVE